MGDIVYSDSAFPDNMRVADGEVIVDSRYAAYSTIEVANPIQGKIPVSDGTGKGFYWMTVTEMLAVHANGIELESPSHYQVASGSEFEIPLTFIPDGYSYRTGGADFINVDKTLQILWGVAPEENGEYSVTLSFEKSLGVNAEKTFSILIEVI